MTVTTMIGSEFGSMYGIAKVLKETSYHLVVAPNFLSTTDLEAAEYIVRNNFADGLIFTRTEPFDARVRMLQEVGFPFVSHGRTEFSTPHGDIQRAEIAGNILAHRLVGKVVVEFAGLAHL